MAAQNFLWGPAGTPLTLLGAELNALSNNGGSNYGTEFGGANNPQLCNLVLHLASNSLAFTPQSYVQVLLVSSTTTIAGAAYPTYTAGATPKIASQNYSAAVIWLNPTTQGANVVDEVATDVIMPLGAFRAILINVSGFALPASGNTLTLIPTPTQY